jgi:hypothetical protein
VWHFCPFNPYLAEWMSGWRRVSVASRGERGWAVGAIAIRGGRCILDRFACSASVFAVGVGVGLLGWRAVEVSSGGRSRLGARFRLRQSGVALSGHPEGRTRMTRSISWVRSCRAHPPDATRLASITELRLVNFKAFEKFSMTIGHSTYAVGPNNAGKWVCRE